MGRIKTKLIKRVSKDILARHGTNFKKDFNSNKLILARYADISSKKLRNIIAGYITRLKNNTEEI